MWNKNVNRKDGEESKNMDNISYKIVYESGQGEIVEKKS